jgi:hypothetical protein
MKIAFTKKLRSREFQGMLPTILPSSFLLSKNMNTVFETIILSLVLYGYES